MIKNRNTSLLGSSNTKLPETDYEGKSSATIDVTVDNYNREIYANVRMHDVIGVDSGKAYPSYLGNQNRELIINLEKGLAEETNRATTAESTLYDTMKEADELLRDYSETSDIKILDIMKTYDDMLTQQIVAEETRASSVEKELNDYITNIHKELANADIRLKENIDSVQAKVDSDIEPRLAIVETFFDEADENGIIDKLEELQKYIEEDVSSATTMLNSISNLEERVDNIHIPENISELNNDAGYITEVPSEYVTEQELADKHYATEENVESLIADTFYTKEEVLELFSRIEFIDGGKAPL